VAPISTNQNEITYRQPWPGVDVVYETGGSQIAKSNYLLAPGFTSATIEQIVLDYQAPVRLTPRGDLAITCSGGEFVESAPIAWQMIAGKKVPIKVGFCLCGLSKVGFVVKGANPSYPLVIDPSITWNTFIGRHESETENGYGLAMDSSGSVYLTGYSDGPWPEGGSPKRGYSGGTYDAFAVKLDPSGNLLWNSFLGGLGADYGQSIAVDGSANVLLGGYSSATWGSPVRGFSIGWDAIAVKLDSNGNLLWHTFLGGEGSDYGYSIAVDGSANVLLGGQSSDIWGSPVRGFSSGWDAIAVKLDPSGNLLWNSFLGGAGSDYGRSIAVDGSANVLLGGQSNDTWGSPVRGFISGIDAIAVKLDSSGNLRWNTFLGGGGSDRGCSIAVDGSANVLLGGYSSVTWGSPVRGFSSGWDAIAVKLDSNGNLLWNTFLGGGASDYGYSIAVDGSANVLLGGDSGSSWGSPLRGFSSGYDAIAVKLDESGNLLWNSFLGGAGSDYGRSIAVDGSANVLLGGYNNATWGSPLRAYSNGEDAFAVKLETSGNLRWNTFLGGAGTDAGYSIAVDGSGNVLLGGQSSATWGSPLRGFSGNNDAIAVKLDGSGNPLWNTFLGGAGDDWGRSIAVDGSANVLLGGYSNATWGSPLRGYSGSNDAIAVKLDSNGNLLWNTFLGGAGSDYGRSVAVDGSANVLLGGESGASVL
jgi:hypothetical protein